MILAAIPCVVFLAAPYVLRVMELAQNRDVILLATGMLIGFPFALTAMEYLFQFLKLPRGILVHAGFVLIDDQYFPGQLAQIETDQSGQRWLIVQNRFERIRIGIDESLSALSILSALKVSV